MKSLFLGVLILTSLTFTSCDNSNGDKNITIDDAPSDMFLVYSGAPEIGHPINTRSWMANIKDEISIADITIPGTHDSAASLAYGYEAVTGESYIIAQSKSITDQLKLGVRFLDLRIYFNSDDILQITHGIYNIKRNFNDVLHDTKVYLNNNPTETVILLLKQEDSDLEDKTFSKYIYEALAKQGLDKENFYLEDGPLPSINEVRGKMVIFRRFKLDGYKHKLGHYIRIPDMDTGNSHKESSYKYFTQDYYTVDQGEKGETNYWYKALLVKNTIKKALNGGPDERLFLNYVSANDVGINNTLRDVAKYLNKKADGFVKDRKGQGKAGVILINFAGTTGDDLTPHLVKHIIEINNFDYHPWTVDNIISSKIGTHTQGGGITMGDIRGDGTNRLVSFYIDDPKGENKAYFRVSNSISNGNINGWENTRYRIPGHFGSTNSGAGITMGDIDGDSLNEMFIFFIDQKGDEENNAYYMMGSHFNTENDNTSTSAGTWTNRIKIDTHFGKYNSGAGITIGDTDGDGRQNLIIFYIDNPDGPNRAYYRVSLNLNTDGTIETDKDGKSWSERIPVTYNDGQSHFGSENSGAGITIGDIDNDGGQNLIITFIDNPNGENAAFYMVSSNINPDGTVDSWSKRKKIYGWIGSETSASGVTMGNVDDDPNSSEDLILYFIDNPDGENTDYYKIGLNKKLDNSLLLESY